MPLLQLVWIPQVVLGSHRCGRIEHSLQFGQTVAEQQQVDWICKEFAHVHVEMDPGYSDLHNLFLNKVDYNYHKNL